MYQAHIGDNCKSSENILIIDDITSNLVLLTAIIRKADLTPRPVSSVKQAIEEINKLRPDLILLDISMPEMDGFEFCSILKSDIKTRDIPVIILLHMYSSQDKVRGYRVGAADYISKPFETEEIINRVQTQLQICRLKNKMLVHKKKFHKLVYDQIHRSMGEQKSIIWILDKMLEYRGYKKANHMKIIGENCRILSMGLQMSTVFMNEISDSFVDDIHLTASLHDIGNVTINDKILTKPGQLTDEEIEIMKTHAESGANILNEIYQYNELNEYIKMAIDIAHYHHEKWDGSGYPKGLAGKVIPLSARIVSVVDIYDTLTSNQCYRPAYTREESLTIMNEESGKSFDPDIIEVFSKIEMKFKTGDNINDETELE